MLYKNIESFAHGFSDSCWQAYYWLEITYPIFDLVESYYPSSVSDYGNILSNFGTFGGSSNISITSGNFSYCNGMVTINGVRQKPDLNSKNEVENAIRNVHWYSLNSFLKKIVKEIAIRIIGPKSRTIFSKKL